MIGLSKGQYRVRSVQHTTRGRGLQVRRLLSKKSARGQLRRGSVASQLKMLRKAYPKMVKGALKRMQGGTYSAPLVTVKR